MVTFPTRPTKRTTHAPTLGTPVEADACRCGDRQRVPNSHYECLMCGRLPERVIRDTFERRARQQRLHEVHVGVPAMRF